MVNFLEIFLSLALAAGLQGAGLPPNPLNFAARQPGTSRVDWETNHSENEKTKIADLPRGRENSVLQRSPNRAPGAVGAAHMPSFRRFPPVNLPRPIERFEC